MQSIFKFSSAEKIDASLIEAIKAAFKSKSIIITVEEDSEGSYELSQEMMEELDMRLAEGEATYITAKDSLDKLKKKYGI
jgi:predicted kinase